MPGRPRARHDGRRLHHPQALHEAVERDAAGGVDEHIVDPLRFDLVGSERSVKI